MNKPSKFRKDYDVKYREYLKTSYISQINKVKHVLGRTLILDNDVKYHTLETLELLLVNELKDTLTFQIVNPDTIHFKEDGDILLNSMKYILKRNRKYSDGQERWEVQVRDIYGGIFFNVIDAKKRRNEILRELKML